MGYQTLKQYLNQNCIKGGTKPGLARMEAMARVLNQPQRKVPIIHIAGTNGKGSCTMMLFSILKAAGYRVGVYTSPHLESYAERIRINDQLIPDNRYRQIMGDLIRNVIPKVREQGLEHPGEFELLTMTAFVYFAQEQPDIVLLEVGMGGRIDSTNIAESILCIIMSIGLDHCQALGNTVAEIAGEKAGIMKSGVPVIAAIQSEADVVEVLEEKALEKGSPLLVIQKDCYQLLSFNEVGQTFDLHTAKKNYEKLFIHLLGTHQLENAAAAVTAAEKLAEMGWSIDEAAIRQGLKETRWAGRMEYWELSEDGKGILMDGAHNDPGIHALTVAWEMYFKKRSMVLLLGILDDKDQRTMLKMLLPYTQQVILTKPSDKRADHWQHIADLIHEIDSEIQVEIVDNITDAVDCGLAILQPNSVLCITGSLYLLGDCRSYLKQKIETNQLNLKQSGEMSRRK